ncbi:TRAP transporter small permease [Ottowia sp. SB7-C50]|jgi:TRAP-type C4-dicarboxylate transport system permease small subunit|uniref:TRAP transporter small permease n=1 Tax=Ottowia sp. SB7-C50 TaxID=3081231 RepID=UPI00295598A4|nr:TRAP transporter small permease [Ottowia sp. SB7-C50]WOP14779.1 TRAP transporter small permease [Ottowia sp. SB7-C50]
MSADLRMREGPVGRLLHVLCDICAVIGGVVLIGMAAMTVVSVIGRTFFNSPILGDVELVQLGLAVCVATFLPYTQFRSANIIVDFFTANAAPRTQRWMDGLGAFLYACCTALIAWRVYAGSVMSHENQEASMLMNLPLWIPYALMVPGFVLCTVVGLYQAFKYWTASDTEPGSAT